MTDPEHLRRRAAQSRKRAIKLMVQHGIPDPERWLDGPDRNNRGAVPRRIRDRVGDRDGWICSICAKPVDRDHAWVPPTPRPDGAGIPEDWSRRNHAHPSVEHLLPVCVGGTDDEANLAIAHHGCNGQGADMAVGWAAGRAGNWDLIKAVQVARMHATVAMIGRIPPTVRSPFYRFGD